MVTRHPKITPNKLAEACKVRATMDREVKDAIIDR